MLKLTTEEFNGIGAALNSATSSLIKDAERQIDQALENGEHQMTTIVNIIRNEVEMLLEYMPEKIHMFKEGKLPGAMENYLFEYSMRKAKSFSA